MDENDEDSRNRWFGPKRFGVGYGPRTWQGLLITALAVLVVILIKSGTGSSAAFIGVVPIFVMAAIMFVRRRR